METKAFSAYAQNKELHEQSSSGGVFSLLAIEILKQGGIVFGAAFDEHWNVQHMCIDRIDKLPLLRGSKYVQSILGSTFKEIRFYLLRGKKVLFCGTPCQVNGLLSYLGKELCVNLLTVDFACHGVPSFKVWQSYIGKMLCNIESISFRNKRFGRKTYSLQVVYTSNKTVSSIFTHDMFMQAFIKNYTLRPSCYNCVVKGVNRVSDITLADYWGVSKYSPKMNHLQGVSLLLVHSIKGMKVLNSIPPSEIIINEETLETCVTMNPSIIKSSVKPQHRDEFMSSLDSMLFTESYKKYVSHNKIEDLKLYIKGYVKICAYYLNRIGLNVRT